MKEIMISIQPQWVEKILNGEKTIEIRKTKPKCELPCKVYIYCTKGKYEIFNTLHGIKHNGIHTGYLLNGKVVAEFTLKEVETIEKNQVYNASVVRHNACLNIMQLHDYIKGKGFHAWHIDNLKIYDKPKELSEFRQTRKVKAYNFGIWSLEVMPLTRPPQSWCYVEEL